MDGTTNKNAFEMVTWQVQQVVYCPVTDIDGADNAFNSCLLRKQTIC